MTTSEVRQRRLGARGARVAGALVVTGAAVAVGFAVADRPRPATGQVAPLASATAPVTRGTATQRVQVSGTLGYQGHYSVVHQGTGGILTSAAAPGSTVDRGGELYRVDNRATRLLLGPVPAYRELRAGIPDGPDVRQLEENLVALGEDPGHRIVVNDHFDAATTAAIKRWQGACGLPVAERTGALAFGQVAFEAGPVRVTEVRVAAGTSVAADGEVLSGTSATLVVTAQVGADRLPSVKAGDQVLVRITGSAPISGTVSAIGQAAPPQPGAAASTVVTVPVTVTVHLPAGPPPPDRTPVQVAITTGTHRDVLLVPVTSLLARPAGGYQVRTAEGAAVEVTPVLFDDSAGLVEVTGNLRPGERVEVPVP
ncbi:peptidoglycan-binding domain-containing protein [Amycolatopsis sp. NPDC026612]|uniref:peptidoglycan-binding domain-containing protein n=1 Tax=Amycolatopsis sp. NPDC026612 TaxID=3155466 RepID=UPI0033D26F2D